MKDEALDWFLRLQASPDDAALLSAQRAWMARDARHAEAFARYDALWKSPELGIASARLGERQADRARPERIRTAPPARRRAGLVAALAAAVLLAVGIHQYPVLMVAWQADYVTAAGERQDVTLPDGSKMVLNTASAVALDFKGGRRQVTLLEGEAYFDVIHDPAHPFKVAARFGEVEVRGTAFAVRRDESEDNVVLKRGSVSVSRLSNRQDAVMLKPGEAVTVGSAELSPVTRTDAESALAWLDGRIIFQEKPLGRVVADLRRYYGGPIVLISGSAGQVAVSGNYRLANPESVVRSLAEAMGIGVTRLPGGILILR